MAAPAVEVVDVTRTFRVRNAVVKALDQINMTISEGEVVGLLGENGAGKTTLTKILATLLHPTTGSAAVFGHDIVRSSREARRLSIAVFGGDRGLYVMLSGYENLRYFGALNGLRTSELQRKVPELLEQVGLGGAMHRRVETYSKGMRQRLHIAVALLVRPPLLLLDEPTVGLDPLEANRVRQTVAEMHDEGATVLLTSHNLQDIERLASRVVMIAAGRVTHDLSLEDFRHITGIEAVVTATLAGRGKVEIPVEHWSVETLDRLRAEFADEQLLDLTVRPTSLEDAFALATGAHS